MNGQNGNGYAIHFWLSGVMRPRVIYSRRDKEFRVEIPFGMDFREYKDEIFGAIQEIMESEREMEHE